MEGIIFGIIRSNLSIHRTNEYNVAYHLHNHNIGNSKVGLDILKLKETCEIKELGLLRQNSSFLTNER